MPTSSSLFVNVKLSPCRMLANIGNKRLLWLLHIWDMVCVGWLREMLINCWCHCHQTSPLLNAHIQSKKKIFCVGMKIFFSLVGDGGGGSDGEEADVRPRCRRPHGRQAQSDQVAREELPGDGVGKVISMEQLVDLFVWVEQTANEPVMSQALPNTPRRNIYPKCEQFGHVRYFLQNVHKQL